MRGLLLFFMWPYYLVFWPIECVLYVLAIGLLSFFDSALRPPRCRRRRYW